MTLFPFLKKIVNLKQSFINDEEEISLEEKIEMPKDLLDDYYDENSVLD